MQSQERIPIMPLMQAKCLFLSPAANATATLASSAIAFNWDDNSGSSIAKQTDKALLAVVNPDKSEAVYDTTGATRVETTLSVNLPADWAGADVETYFLEY